MTGIEFLAMVWPLTGPYLLATPTTYEVPDSDGGTKTINTYQQFAFDTPEEAYEVAKQWTKDNKDTFYAMGSLKEVRYKPSGYLDSPRVATNIKEIRAFWIDLDVKPDQYISQAAAVEALRQFVKSAGLPKPWLVSSGFGIHVYWPLTDALDSNKWRHYAELFKRITVAAGMKTDPARTSDAASVLRVPGTLNCKPGRPTTEVKILMEGAVTQTEDFLKRIAFLATSKNISAAPPKTFAAANAAIAANNELANTFTPVPAATVVKRCPHLKWQVTHPTEVSQPLWYAAIGVMRHCIDGDKACHAMSKLDTVRYSSDDVDAKIDQLARGGYGPTTCAKFESEGSAQCATCRWKGKVGSPITLATMADEAAAPVMQVLVKGETVEVELPEPPFPYRRVIENGDAHARIARVVISDDKGTEVETVEEVYPYDIYPYALFYDEATRGYAAKVKHWLPMEGWKDMELPFVKAHDSSKLYALLGHIGVMTKSKNMGILVDYMIGYIAELQKKTAAQVLYAQLGWKNDFTQFVAPGLVVTETDTIPCAVSDNIIRGCNNWKEAQGDLEVWKDIANAYNKPACVAHQFIVMAGFASVLMPMTNYRGAIVAAVGEKGCGKSTAAEVANTIFGHRHQGDITALDTGNAMYAKLGALHNLMAAYDESTKLDGDSLSSLAYSITQGQGKNRLDREGNFRENVGSWALILLMTTNKSPQSVLGAYSSDSSAEASRIFQVMMVANTMTKAEADDCFYRLDTNFGLAGPVFIQEVIRTKDEVAARIRYWTREIDRVAHVTSGERFWSAVPACALAALEVCNRIDLIRYDIQYMFDYVIKVINGMRINVSENVGTPIGILADYFNTNLRNTLIVSPMAGGAGQITKVSPNSELRIRIDEGLGRAYVDRAHLRRFCVDKGADFPTLKTELEKEGVLVSDDKKIMLGKGTSISSLQTRCIELDMTKSAVTGLAEFVKDVSNNVIALDTKKQA